MSVVLDGKAIAITGNCGVEEAEAVIGARKQGRTHLRGRGEADRQPPPGGARVIEAPSSERTGFAERNVG